MYSLSHARFLGGTSDYDSGSHRPEAGPSEAAQVPVAEGPYRSHLFEKHKDFFRRLMLRLGLQPVLLVISPIFGL